MIMLQVVVVVVVVQESGRIRNVWCSLVRSACMVVMVVVVVHDGIGNVSVVRLAVHVWW